jgi:hypothetical protein
MDDVVFVSYNCDETDKDYEYDLINDIIESVIYMSPIEMPFFSFFLLVFISRTVKGFALQAGFT